MASHPELDEEQTPEPVQRLLGYAGKQRRDVSNPCITAREAIEIANWIQAEIELLRSKLALVLRENRRLSNDLKKVDAEMEAAKEQGRREAEAARATARIAIGHLQAVLNGCKTHAEQQTADTAARLWLQSIGGD